MEPLVEEIARRGLQDAGVVAQPFLERLLGPATEELGQTLADSIRVRRLKKSLAHLKRVQEICAEADFQPRRLSLKAVLPILEAASLEDDERLSEMWAALLANAAKPVEPVEHPAFVEVLRQLSSADALALDEFRKDLGTERAAKRKAISDRFAAANLARLGICDIISRGGTISAIRGETSRKPLWLRLTPFGEIFLEACSRPVKSATDG